MVVPVHCRFVKVSSLRDIMRRLEKRATRHCGLKKRREESGTVSGDGQEGEDKVKGRGRSFREMGQLSL